MQKIVQSKKHYKNVNFDCEKESTSYLYYFENNYKMINQWAFKLTNFDNQLSSQTYFKINMSDYL